MNRMMLAVGSLFALALLGCGDNTQPAPTTAPKPPSAPTAAAPAPAQSNAPVTVITPAATPSAPAPTPPAAPVNVAPAPAATAMPMPAASMPPLSMPAATVPAATVAAADTLTSKADGLLAQATQAIKDKKWDIADGAVTQLQNYKSNLPAEYGPRIDQVKTLLDGAKALTQPSLPTSLPGLRF